MDQLENVQLEHTHSTTEGPGLWTRLQLSEIPIKNNVCNPMGKLLETLGMNHIPNGETSRNFGYEPHSQWGNF